MISVFSSSFQEAANNSCLHDIRMFIEEVDTNNIGTLAKCRATKIPVCYGGVNALSTTTNSAQIWTTKRQEGTLCPQAWRCWRSQCIFLDAFVEFVGSIFFTVPLVLNSRPHARLVPFTLLIPSYNNSSPWAPLGPNSPERFIFETRRHTVLW